MRHVIKLESGAFQSTGAFGGFDPRITEKILSQVLNVLHPDPKKPVDEATIGEAIALIESIKPTDALEAMTAAMFVAAQHAAMDMMRRAMHPDQTAAGRQSYTGHSLKAMQTASRLHDSLNRGRGKGMTQRVIVERVTVEAGGRAIVGAVAPPRLSGDHSKSEQQSYEPTENVVTRAVEEGDAT